ncbi:MAG: response regulator [Elusimicrobia bacterium]|nr:response regulator [Elusimicrobiota bacterium]
MAAKILIVEDEEPIAQTLEALLNAKGYRASYVTDGAEAVARARKEKPDVIFLDVMLPRIGGFDVCKLLTKDPETKRIKVIMITALGRMGDVETAFASGATDYIIKPFDTDRLLKKLEKVLQKSSS